MFAPLAASQRCIPAKTAPLYGHQALGQEFATRHCAAHLSLASGRRHHRHGDGIASRLLRLDRAPRAGDTQAGVPIYHVARLLGDTDDEIQKHADRPPGWRMPQGYGVV
jgi:hypothetical protein